RHPKVMTYKFKPKKRYKLKQGHKQYYTEIQITEIKN
ncbi:MAG: 50S ribosomal protein L21, partial [Parcubacteria bacterium 34_609]